MEKLTRRNFLRKIGGGLVTATGISSFALLLNFGSSYKFKPLYHVSKKIERMKGGGEDFLLRPPGAQGEDDFLAKCIKCYLCLEACPIQAIKIAGRDKGKAADTPYIIAENTGCDLCFNRENMRCNHVCPTDALIKMNSDDKNKVLEEMKMGAAFNMGIAVLDKRICYAWTNVSVCWACYEICPYKSKAITTGLRNIPTIHPESCVGCGLCVEICPVPQKAIVVVPPGTKVDIGASSDIIREKEGKQWSFEVDKTKSRAVPDTVNPEEMEQKMKEKEGGDSWKPSENVDIMKF